VTVPSEKLIKRPTIIRISQPAQRFEKLGDEVRIFNNASASTAVETITVNYRSGVSATVELSQARSLSGTAGVSFFDAVNAKAELQKDLAQRHSIQIDQALTVEQSTVVNVPAYTNIAVTFHWKRIWATGMVVLADSAEPESELAEVPFEITIGLSFDKDTHDIK
jgi:hypothetical protein